MPWPAKLAAYLGSLGLVLLLILLLPLESFGDGYSILGIILSAILMLFILLQMNSKHISRMLELIVGPGTGTTGANSSASSTDSLLSRFTAISVENGQSWLQVSDLLKEQSYLLRGIQQRIFLLEEVVGSNTAEEGGFKNAKFEDTEDRDSE